MNNEEKIIQMIADLSTQFSGMKTEMSDMKTEMSSINTRLDKIEERTTRTEILIENTIIPQIQLLAEGQVTIQNQIKRISVIDRLEDDISTLKLAVKFLSQEVENLKKAM